MLSVLQETEDLHFWKSRQYLQLTPCFRVEQSPHIPALASSEPIKVQDIWNEVQTHKFPKSGLAQSIH